MFSKIIKVVKTNSVCVESNQLCQSHCDKKGWDEGIYFPKSRKNTRKLVEAIGRNS